MAWFERLIDAREQDLAGEPPADMPALQSYAERSSAALSWLALESLGGEAGRTPAAVEAGRRLGAAWALTGLLRAVPYHASQRQLHLPRISCPAMACARRISWSSDGPPHCLLPGPFAGLYLKRLARAGFDPYAAVVQDAPPGRMWRLTLSNLLGRF